MSHYKPYPAYRPSCVEWIGDVPEHWKVGSVKYWYQARLGKMIQPESKNDEDVLVPYHRAQTVQWEQVVHEQVESMWASPQEIETYSLIDGDLLICEGGDVCRAAIFQSDGNGKVIFQNSIHRVRPLDGNQPEWLLHLMKIVRSSGWIDVLCSKNTIVHFTSEKLASLECIQPPISEQLEILAKVHTENLRIDSLINRKTRFIELLKEKRQALITHAVTKGLDPNVKMRDSGDDWIKEIPVTWKSMKFGRIARVTEGLVDPRDEPYRSMVLIAPNHIESGTGRVIQLETAAEQNAESGKYQCRAGNVVYSKIRPALAKVVIAPCDGLCSADMYPVDCTELVEPEWLFYLMLSTSFTAWAILESDRVAMPKINRESLFELGVHVPPRDEQRRVVAFISASVLKSDALLSKTQHSIVLLKERRSAFITAAVTGQIDLREAA